MIAVYWQAMTAGSNAFEQDVPQPELFSALLTPHRSLNRTGFLVLMGFVCAVSFIAGMVFLMMGAWPVLGFFGLDVLAIWWAFRINFRTGKACEEITVTPSELRVRRTSHRGHVVEWVLNPLWVRLDQKATPNSASSGFIWSPGGAGCRSAAFWGRKKKPVLPKPYWPRCWPPSAARPIIPSREACRETGGWNVACPLNQRA